MPAKFGDQIRNSHPTDIEDLYPLENYENSIDLPRTKTSRQGLEREQIRIWLMKEQKTALKIAAITRGTTMQSLVQTLIVRFLDEQ